MLYSKYDKCWTIKNGYIAQIEIRTIYDVYYGCYPGDLEDRFEVAEENRECSEVTLMDFEKYPLRIKDFSRYYKTKEELLLKEQERLKSRISELASEIQELKSVYQCLSTKESSNEGDI